MIPKKFILLDDESTNNLISRIVIRQVFPDAEIREFTDCRTALAYIKSFYPITEFNLLNTILLLDINMPIHNGWDFLAAYKEFEIGIRNQIMIYMLTSSINEKDLVRAKAIKEIHDYIEKPLTDENFTSIIKEFSPGFTALGGFSTSN